MTTRSVFVTMILAATLAAGCAGSDFCGSGLCMVGPSADDGVVSFALSSTDTAVRSFVIKMYKGALEQARGNAYFESPCSPRSKAFSISHLDTGDDYVVEYLGYSDNACSEDSLSRSGIRGGVRVTSSGTGFAYYYVQVNVVGAFTAMPLPGGTLNPASDGVSCQTDSDCRRVIPCDTPDDPDTCPYRITVDCDTAEIDSGDCPDGYKVMQYNVHPKAVCDDGTCRLETLFPLNTRGSRAFSTTVATDSGDAISLGGFTKSADGFYLVEGASDPASAPETWNFMGDQGIFGVLEHDRPLDSGLGMSAGTMFDDGRLIVAGGTHKAMIDDTGSAVGAPIVDSVLCSTDCPVEMSSYLYVIDTVTGVVDRTTLSEALIPEAVVAIPGTSPGVYIRGAASMTEFAGDITSGGSTISWVCRVADVNAVSCTEVNPSSQVSRFMPAGVCINRANGLCSEFLTLGGTENENKFAEIYSAVDNVVKVYPAAGDVPARLTGATAFMAGDAIWLVGGTSDSDKSVPAPPYSVTVDKMAGVVILKKVDLDAAAIKTLARRHHQVTVLADDTSVLVTGGIDANGAITDSAVLLSTSGGAMRVVDSGLEMAEPRMGHSATLLTGGLYDGSVLVSGGVSAAGPEFAKGAEIYVPAN